MYLVVEAFAPLLVDVFVVLLLIKKLIGIPSWS